MKYALKLFTYCLLPQAVYLIVHFSPQSSVDDFLRETMCSYQVYYQTRNETNDPIWSQEIIKQTIATDEDLARMVQWVEERPVALHMCEHASGYPYSSHGLRVLNRFDEHNIIAYS